jgi:hypothetical protein
VNTPLLFNFAEYDPLYSVDVVNGGIAGGLEIWL